MICSGHTDDEPKMPKMPAWCQCPFKAVSSMDPDGYWLSDTSEQRFLELPDKQGSWKLMLYSGIGFRGREKPCKQSEVTNMKCWIWCRHEVQDLEKPWIGMIGVSVEGDNVNYYSAISLLCLLLDQSQNCQKSHGRWLRVNESSS